MKVASSRSFGTTSRQGAAGGFGSIPLTAREIEACVALNYEFDFAGEPWGSGYESEQSLTHCRKREPTEMASSSAIFDRDRHGSVSLIRQQQVAEGIPATAKRRSGGSYWQTTKTSRSFANAWMLSRGLLLFSESGRCSRAVFFAMTFTWIAVQQCVVRPPPSS